MKRKRFSISLILISVVLVGLVLFLVGYQRNSIQDQGDLAIGEVEYSNHTVTIDFGDNAPRLYGEIPYEQDRTLIDLLDAIDQEDDSLEITYRDFGGGLGMFITTINSVGDNDTTKWWQYWINDNYAQVGISSYVLNPGDAIRLVYTNDQNDL